MRSRIGHLARAVVQQRRGQRSGQRIGHRQIRGDHAAQRAACTDDFGHHRAAARQPVHGFAVGHQVGDAGHGHCTGDGSIVRRMLGVLLGQIPGKCHRRTGCGIHVIDGFHSGEDLCYFNQATGEKYIPYVIEPAAGLTRSLMCFLVDAYDVDEAPNTKGGVDKRTVLRLDPRLAPVKAAVLPLSKKPELRTVAQNLADDLRFNEWMIDYDESGAIGRRYRRQDEIGTPLCITVDFDTLEDHAVTIRERDTMAQDRVALDKVADYVAARIGEKRTRVPLKPVEMGGEAWPESGVQEAGGLY